MARRSWSRDGLGSFLDNGVGVGDGLGGWGLRVMPAGDRGGDGLNALADGAAGDAGRIAASVELAALLTELYMTSRLSAKQVCEVARLACAAGAVGGDLARLSRPDLGDQTGHYNRHLANAFGFEAFLSKHAYDISVPGFESRSSR